MSDLSITVAGSARQVASGTTAADLFADDRSIVVARVNDELRDLAQVLDAGDVVEPVTIDSDEGLAVLRHSCCACAGPSRAGDLPRRQARDRPTDQGRLLLRLRRRDTVHPRGPQGLEKRMISDHQVGAAVPTPCGDEEEARAELADEPYKFALIGSEGGAGVTSWRSAEPN